MQISWTVKNAYADNKCVTVYNQNCVRYWGDPTLPIIFV